MSKTTTNLIVLLGIVTVMVGGYFFFTQDSTMFLQSSASDQQLERLLVSSQLFVERSSALAALDIDTTVFDSVVFDSLKVFSLPPDEYLIGRLNPFAPTDTSILPSPTITQ
jgi:hypothetical protein